jgi:hypothetical protein
MSQSTNGSLPASVLSLPVEEQEAGGFRHTLREIWQQPELWEVTAEQIAPLLGRWRELLENGACQRRLPYILTARSSSIFCVSSAASFFLR